MIKQYSSLEELLKCTDLEQQVYMPNEIFDDLMKNEKLRAKNGKNLAFAYSFYYLSTWLYRNCKHANIIIEEKDTTNNPINVKHMKEMLGYSPTYRNIDFIINKNGVLEEMGYIHSTTDYPTSWTFENIPGGSLEFELLSDMSPEDIALIREYRNVSRNYKVKYPIKAFYRTQESEEDGYEDGTFFDPTRTFMIPFEVLNFSMKDKRLGVTAFYLWSYFKYKNQWHEGAYYASRLRLVNETGLSNDYLDDVLDWMKKFNMITATVEQDYIMGLHKQYCKPISYIANDPFDKDNPFYITPTKEYKKAKTISYKEHMDKVREEMEGEKCDVLPLF